MKDAEEGEDDKAAADARPQLFVTRFTLSPGAPLRALAEGRDVLIVGMGDGYLVNEAKLPAIPISVSNGSVLLMLKEEKYLLRNIGKQDLNLLVIDVRR